MRILVCGVTPNQISNVKTFIDTNLRYYASLYEKIRSNPNKYLLYSNKINSLAGMYENIMAACVVDDPCEDVKIETISKEYDRMYVLLQLNQAYDSNKFQELSYNLNEKLINANVSDYRRIFDEVITEHLKEKKNKDKLTSLLDYDTFYKNSYISLPITVLKYVLARVEEYICNSINQEMQASVVDLATKTSAVYGYHVEHILSENDTNRAYFDNEEEFEEKRNYIGGLLILKGRSNISSGNEEYTDKLKTYGNGLVWGHTLCSDFYHANPDFSDFNSKLDADTNVSFKPLSVFDKDALKYRSKLLFEIVKKIWEIS